MQLSALFTHSTPGNEPTTEHVQRAHSGQRAHVFGEVDPATYDRDEVGSLHLIEFEDGTIFEAFSDELSDWKETAI